MHRRSVFGADLLTFAVVLLVFGRSIAFPLTNWDDYEYIVAYPLVRHPLADGWKALLLTAEIGYPTPLSIVTHHIDYLVGGGAGWPFHLTNVVLHAVNAALLRRVIQSYGVSLHCALAAAILFAVHPIVAEPVCWATGRKDLLAGCAILLSLLVYRHSGERPSIVRLGAMTALFVAALLSKPTAIVLPVLPVIDRLATRRAIPGRLAAFIVVTAAMGLTDIVITMPDAVRTGGLGPFDLAPAAATISQHLALQLRNVFIPLWLSPLYFEAFPAPVLSAWGMAGVLAVAATVTAVVVAWRSGLTAVAVGLMWMVSAFAPASGIVPLTRGPADSYFYVPLAGMALAFAGLLTWGERRLGRASMLKGVLVLGLGCALLAFRQAGRWQSSTSLWQPLLELYPEQPSSHQLYGDALLLEGRAMEAILHLERALELSSSSDDASGMEILAAACFEVRRYDCALRWYAEAVRRFGPSPGRALRLLSSSLFEPAPLAEVTRARRVARRVLAELAKGGRRERSDRLRRFFDAHLRSDTVPVTALKSLSRDPEVGGVSRALLALYEGSHPDGG